MILTHRPLQQQELLKAHDANGLPPVVAESVQAVQPWRGALPFIAVTDW